MKKLLLLISLVILSNQESIAQCTPEANANQTGFYPEVLETYCLNQSYDDTLTFVLPPDTVISGFLIPIDSVIVTGISNIPNGVTYECQFPNCTFYSNPPNNIVGCLSFSGTPTTIPAIDTIQIEVTAWITFFGSPTPFSQTISQVRMPGDDCVDGNVCTEAVAIDNLLGGAIGAPQTSSLYDNTNNTSIGDPTNGYECFFNSDGLANTIWYSFVGDGNPYNITTVQCNATNYISFGDTQAALYSGNCGSLSPVACAEDLDESTGAFNFDMNVTLQNGVQYYLMVDGYQNFPGEFCLEFTRQSTVSVSESELLSIDVYPNPTENNISWNGVNAQTAEIYDNAGRVVISVSQPNGRVDLSNLIEGVYILKVFTNEGTYTSRVIKQ